MPRKFSYIVLLTFLFDGIFVEAHHVGRAGYQVSQDAAQSHRSPQRLPSRNMAGKDSFQISSVFADIQKGIQSEDVQVFLRHFATQVYVNLRNVENGYYSANQAGYVLKNFFGARRVANFRLSTVSEDGSAPYATGAGSFMHRGRRESLQIYVGLTKAGHQWLISQFNVY